MAKSKVAKGPLGGIPADTPTSALFAGDLRSFTGDSESADTSRVAIPPFAELGVTGLKRFSGYVLEEFHKKLTGDRALKTYEEMQANSPMVWALLFAISQMMRQVEWRVDPCDNTAEAEDVAEFVDQCRQDMSQSWEDVLDEVFSMVAYGFSYHEIVYKRRLGAQREGGKTPTSAYDDGKIGWRKLPIRAQVTRLRWEFDPEGGIRGMWQLAPPLYRLTFLPIEKCLLFRPQLNKNNPEGRSILRSAYRPWYFAMRLEEIEAIGIERDLAGLPVIEVPAEICLSTASPDQQAVFESFKKIVTNLRRGEQEGVVMPQSYDANKNPQYKLSLLSTLSRRQFDTNATIQRYNLQILQAALADFIAVGHEKVGSFALASSKTDVFGTALGSWLDAVAHVFNRHAIPRLLTLNGIDLKLQPELCHGDVETPDLEVVSDFIGKMSQAGLPFFPDLKTENVVRGWASLPEVSQEEFDDRQQKIQDQQDAEHQANLELAAAKKPRTNSTGGTSSEKPESDETPETEGIKATGDSGLVKGMFITPSTEQVAAAMATAVKEALPRPVAGELKLVKNDRGLIQQIVKPDGSTIWVERNVDGDIEGVYAVPGEP